MQRIEQRNDQITKNQNSNRRRLFDDVDDEDDPDDDSEDENPEFQYQKRNVPGKSTLKEKMESKRRPVQVEQSDEDDYSLPLEIQEIMTQKAQILRKLVQKYEREQQSLAH